ncbi:MAG: hypothetical protein QOJ84_1595 [Bradyrhizobium sp.]|jgi:hypothetical protein|nr:hypothetical protein [Bradyrhizobium sp.]
MKKKTKRSYSVGHGKPPVHTRFRKGKSGNPSGRRRKVVTFEDKIAKILAQTQTINVGGESMSMTLEELLITSVVQNAIRCKNAKSIMVALEWVRELDATRKRSIKLASQPSQPPITREMLAKMTYEEQINLYNKTLDQAGEPQKGSDGDSDSSD